MLLLFSEGYPFAVGWQAAERNSVKGGKTKRLYFQYNKMSIPRWKTFTRRCIPDSPLFTLASHPRLTVLGTEIHQRSQCPFILYLSQGRVNFTCPPWASWCRAGTEHQAASPGSQALPQNCLRCLSVPPQRYKKPEAAWDRFSRRDPKTIPLMLGNTKGAKFCVKEEEPAQKSLAAVVQARTFIRILLSIPCLFFSVSSSCFGFALLLISFLK